MHTERNYCKDDLEKTVSFLRRVGLAFHRPLRQQSSTALGSLFREVRVGPLSDDEKTNINGTDVRKI